MNKIVIRHIWMLAIATMLAAVFDSQIAMILVSGLFIVSALVFPGSIFAVASVICVILYALVSPHMITGAFVALTFILPSFAMAVAVKRRCGLEGILAAGTLTRAVTVFGYYYFISVFAHTTVKDVLVGTIPSALLERASELGYSDAQLDVLRSSWELFGDLLPMYIGVAALLFSFLSFAFAKAIIKRTGGKLEYVSDFSDMRLSPGFSGSMIIIAFAAVFAHGSFEMIILNTINFMYAVFMLYGFAAVYRLIKKIIKNRAVGFVLTAAVGLFSLGIVPAGAGMLATITKQKKQ